MEVSLYCYYKVPWSKCLSAHEIAHKWVKDIGIRPDIEHESGMLVPQYANIGQDRESAQHGAIRRHRSRGLMTTTSLIIRNKNTTRNPWQKILFYTIEVLLMDVLLMVVF